MNQAWKVHKFGGTSVLNADRYRNVFKIITEMIPESRKAIVVSAMKGVTDDLIKCVELAKNQKENYKDLLQQIQSRHKDEVTKLLRPDNAKKLLVNFESEFHKISEILRGIWLVKSASENIIEQVSGMGEVFSAQILSSYIEEQNIRTNWLDAREVLIVKKAHQRVVIDWEKSRQKMKSWLNQNNFDLFVITGFVAALEDGTATSLGRNGSDYSASIFGSLLNCDEIFIWTDVDGILSADPRQVPEAIILDEMSYNEVTELAYFGAKVVHPATMTPAIDQKIPIWIKNTLNPTCKGTKIHALAKSKLPVKGLSMVHDMALINLEGTGMVGIPGVAERLFSGLSSAGVNVVLISQASSEQSICVAVSEAQAEAAKQVVEQSFFAEIQRGLIRPIQITRQISILAAVGDNMASTPGVAGMFFTSLGRSGVNIRAIAQGSSERNISVVIDSQYAMKALRTVHSSFILPHQRISIGLIGPGLIGETFLRQLHEQKSASKDNEGVHFQVRGIANSKKMYISEQEISLSDWKKLFESQAQPLDMKKFIEHIHPDHIPHATIIESTASDALIPFYKDWLSKGLHIISPNKKANSSSMKNYLEIRESAQKANRHFLYSTNVGAGLPLIQTLRDLCATGDEIVTIQGILSGTLSFIFNQYDGTKPFSEIVMQAKQKGYTEPDPREDLSGADVVRKIVILAREAGMKIETQDVKATGLVPEILSQISAEEFLKRLTEMDQVMAEKMQTAKIQKQILRFVATVNSNGTASVGLESLASNHPFSGVHGTDNIVLFKTKRYFDQPLIVQGPGAGPEVTAAGVFADLLRLSRYLGAFR